MLIDFNYVRDIFFMFGTYDRVFKSNFMFFIFMFKTVIFWDLWDAY